MKSTKLDVDISVSEQLTVADVAEAAKAGFRSIICNRPNGEGWGQPEFAEIERAAKAAGLDAAYLPIMPGGMSAQQVQSFADLMATLPKPILAYCRSGARSTGLWSASAPLRRQA